MSAPWRLLLALLITGPGCGERGEPQPTPGADPSAVTPGTRTPDAGASLSMALAPDAAPEAPSIAPLVIDAQSGSDPGLAEPRALAAIPAVPVWHAVVERGRYLARRQQHGAIHGYLGSALAAGDVARGPADHPDGGPDHPDPGPTVDQTYRWIIDETQGAGSLGVRVQSAAIPGLDTLEEGTRVVLWGAWHIAQNGEPDSVQRWWYWKPTRVATLEPRPAPAAPAPDAAPGHEIAELARPPADAQPVSQLESRPDVIVFQVTRVPRDPSGGWEIADRSRDPTMARLFLPGDQATYGAQDLRTSDERWRLRRGISYVVEVRRITRRPSDKRPRVTARGAPRRLIGRSLTKPR